MSTQRATDRCECGELIAIMPTISRWEFEWECRRCRRGGVISWAHIDPPPHYEAPKQDAQMPLFEVKP